MIFIDQNLKKMMQSFMQTHLCDNFITKAKSDAGPLIANLLGYKMKELVIIVWSAFLHFLL